MLYVLDEPSIGLHQRDNRALLTTLGRLRDLGNTVIVVEHDEETIRKADYVVDLGPGAGEHGGEVIFQGTPAQLLGTGPRPVEGNQAPAPPPSLTGAYLRGERRIETPRARRAALKGEIVIRGARANNLKNLDVAIPAGDVHGGDRRERVGQVHARERDSLQVAGAAAVSGVGRSRAPTTASTASRSSTR